VDTAPIRPDERFDEVRVEAFLRAEMPEAIGDLPVVFEQFPGGKANLTYLARAGNTELVLRRPPLGPLAPGAHDMTREFRVLSVLHRSYSKAPRAFVLCEDAGIMGAPFFVMERRHGHVVRESWPPGLEVDDAFRRQVGENLVDALAELHLVDHEALGLGDLGRPDGFVERQVAGWSGRWERAKHRDLPAMEEVARRLAAAVPVPQAATLLHNDFKLDNTMIDDGGSIVAVFDWDMSTTGDPLVDVGTTLAYWSGGGLGSFAAADSVMLGDAFGPPDIIERYADATGFDLAGIDWYRALGLFRIAVIVQQIYIRWVRGQTKDDRFEGLGELVPPMAEAAIELL
jgi:aminoglycoside phosphotransferase (APT) family kinase protein